MRGPLCACQAGCCAALASVSAKVATSFDASRTITTGLIGILRTTIGLDLIPYAEEVRHLLVFLVYIISRHKEKRIF